MTTRLQEPSEDAPLASVLQRISAEPAEFVVLDDSSGSDGSDDEVVKGEPAAPARPALTPFSFPTSSSSAPTCQQGLSRFLLLSGRLAVPKILAEAHSELKAAQSAVDAMGTPLTAPTSAQLASRKEAKTRRKRRGTRRGGSRRSAWKRPSGSGERGRWSMRWRGRLFLRAPTRLFACLSSVLL